MTTTNAYATTTQFKAWARITSTDTTDDGVIDDLLTNASRIIDAICGVRFFASTETHTFDIPASYTVYSPRDESKTGGGGSGRTLVFDAPLLSVTTFTNGDGTAIASTQYNLFPYNQPHKDGLTLKASATAYWLPDSSGNSEAVISVGGLWGYVNRASTDALSYERIFNTQQACLIIAKDKYNKRFGQNGEGVAQVTGAGVVITPQGAVPKEAWEYIRHYIRLQF